MSVVYYLKKSKFIVKTAVEQFIENIRDLLKKILTFFQLVSRGFCAIIIIIAAIVIIVFLIKYFYNNTSEYSSRNELKETTKFIEYENSDYKTSTSIIESSKKISSFTTTTSTQNKKTRSPSTRTSSTTSTTTTTSTTSTTSTTTSTTTTSTTTSTSTTTTITTSNTTTTTTTTTTRVLSEAYTTGSMHILDNNGDCFEGTSLLVKEITDEIACELIESYNDICIKNNLKNFFACRNHCLFENFLQKLILAKMNEWIKSCDCEDIKKLLTYEFETLQNASKTTATNTTTSTTASLFTTKTSAEDIVISTTYKPIVTNFINETTIEINDIVYFNEDIPLSELSDNKLCFKTENDFVRLLHNDSEIFSSKFECNDQIFNCTKLKIETIRDQNDIKYQLLTYLHLIECNDKLSSKINDTTLNKTLEQVSKWKLKQFKYESIKDITDVKDLGLKSDSLKFVCDLIINCSSEYFHGWRFILLIDCFENDPDYCFLQKYGTFTHEFFKIKKNSVDTFFVDIGLRDCSNSKTKLHYSCFESPDFLEDVRVFNQGKKKLYQVGL